MRRFGFVSTCVAGCLALALAGCSGGGDSQVQSSAQDSSAAQATQEQTADEQSSSDAAQKAADTQKATDAASQTKVLGEQTQTSAKISLTNGLDKAVDEISIRTAGDGEYGQNLLGEGEQIAANETATLNVEAGSEGAAVDLRISVADSDETSEVLAVPVSDVKSMTLKATDGTYYIDYVLQDGTEQSTKAEDANASEGADASTAAQSTTTATTATDNGGAEDNVTYDESYDTTYTEPEVTYEDTSYVEPTYEETYTEPVYEEPVAEAAPEQTSDVCAGDVLLRD